MQLSTPSPIILPGTSLSPHFHVSSDERMLVQASLELIVDPSRFTTLYPARDKDGRFCQPAAQDAVSWCAVGTFYRYPSCFDKTTQDSALNKMQRFLRTMPLTHGRSQEYHRTIPDRIPYIQDLNDEIIAIVLDDNRSISGHEGVVYLFERFLELPVSA